MAEKTYVRVFPQIRLPLEGTILTVEENKEFK